MAQGAGLVALLLLLLAIATIVSGSLIESRAQSKQLQRAIRHRQVVVVVEGVRERMTGAPSPDPLVLINFPDIDSQFKVHLLEDSNTLKLTLAQNDIDSKFLSLHFFLTYQNLSAETSPLSKAPEVNSFAKSCTWSYKCCALRRF